MPEIRETITIDRPIDEVFDFVSDPSNMLLWNSNLTRYEADAPRMAKGARAHGATRVAGKQVEWTSEVSEFEPGQHYVIRSLEAPMNFMLEYRFTDLDGHTRIDFHQEVDSIGGFFGKLADPLVTRMYSHDVQSNLAQLKELLEG